jgi:outer membrane protein
MRARLILGWLVILTMVAAIGYAQEAPARKLSLAEALDIARRNNPDYLSYLSARSPASWSLTNSTARLLTPTFGVSGGYFSQAAATGQIIQGFQIPATPSYHQSSLSLSFSYQLSGLSIASRGYDAAQLNAADMDIAGALTLLETSVKQEYITWLAARAQADYAQHVVNRAEELLNLAQARYNVGQNTMIDVRRAQVDKGTADVSLINAWANVNVEILKLYQWLGVPAPEPLRLEPSDTFPVVEPKYNEDSLIGLALGANPTLRAIRAREGAARWNVRGAYAQYLPSLQAGAGTGKSWITSGTTSYNQKNPWYFQLGISLPIYDAFSRNQQVSQANYVQESLNQSIRKEELTVRATVAAAYLAVLTAYRTIAVQANNRTAADEALSLATERYRVGSGSIIELLDARVTSEQAGVTYINAVYDYHKAIAVLEQAVGLPLR